MKPKTKLIIPKQLKECRFIKTNDAKRGIEKLWPSKANYSLNEFNFNVNTYGVLCGANNLIVVDCDQKYVQDKLLQIDLFRKTFTVRTATKRLYHFYFFVTGIEDQPNGFRIDNAMGDRIIDLQGRGLMVLGPNSTLSNGSKYDVVNDVEIKKIDYKILCTILQNIEIDVKVVTPPKSKGQWDIPELDSVCAAIKRNVKIKDLLISENIDVSKNPTMCPLGHDSKGEKCFSFTDEVFYCFHCYQTGNVLQLYQKLHNCNFITARVKLADKAGLIKDIKERVLFLYSHIATRAKASELLANEFIHRNKVYTIREDKELEMWLYNDGIYKPEARSYIKEFCRDILGSEYKETFVNKVIDKISVDTFIVKERFFINEDVNLIPVRNGILDINTKKIMDYSESRRFFNKIPVIYDSVAKSERIISFIKSVVEHKEDVMVIQELMGFLLYRDYKYANAFMLLGKGRNGKTRLLEVFKNLIGEGNYVNIPLQTIENDQFAVSNLQNKLANLSGDISKKDLEETDMFKSLVGKDPVTANRKFKTPVTFLNYAKLIFSSNGLPKTRDESDGFWDRWTIIDFPYKFVDNPKSHYERKKDTNIMDKIINDKEMSGILNWALEGLDRLFKNGNFSKSFSTKKIQEKWRRESSSVWSFVMQCMELTGKSSDYFTTNQIEEHYTTFCQEKNLVIESYKKRANILLQFGSFRKVVGTEVKQRVYAGIKFKESWLKDHPLEESENDFTNFQL